MKKEKRFNIVSLTDWHAPYHDPKAIDVAFKFCKYLQPEIIIIHEAHDFYSLSRFDKDPNRANNLQEEIDQVTELFARLRSLCPKSRIILLKSNHLDRLRKYLWTQAQALSSLKVLNIENLLNLKALKIEYRDTFMFRDFLFKHGDIVRRYSSYTSRAEFDKEGTSGASGHCFSEDTEVLTINGWKKFEEIKIGEQVLTRNLETGASEWNKIKDVFSYDNYKELVSVKNQVFDLLVTEDHALVASPYKVGKYERIKAKDCKRYDKFYSPNGGINTNKDFPIEDDLLRLIAWVVTEGNISKEGYIRIAQSEKPKVGIKHITDICDRLGQGYSVIKRYSAGTTEHGQHRNYDAYRINLKKSEVTELIRRFVPTKKLLNQFYKLSKRQFDLFFDELILADGCKNKEAKNSYQYASKWKEEIDAFQAICAYNGYRTSCIKRERFGKDVYTLTINTKGYSALQGKNLSNVPYSGKVWCASVDNQTLVVRRNGKVCVAGNTHRLGMHFTTKRGGKYVWLESGCLCNTNPEYIEGTADWQQGFSLVSFKKGSKHFTPHILPIISGEIMYGDITIKL